MKTKVLFFYLMTATLLCNAAPELPNEVKVSLPTVLGQALIKQSDINNFLASGDWGQSKVSKKYWIVYSDRSNNTTYNDANEASGKFKELDINEKVRIAQIKGDFALVYDEPQMETYPKISKKAICKGWIPMKHLLLWEMCPTNEAGIYQKALAVINLDEVQKNGDLKKELAKRYMNPSTKEGELALNASMNFYFVMKEDKETQMILLSKECKMSGGNTVPLAGWVNRNSFIPWNQRTCLEPNWIPEQASHMENDSIPVYGNLVSWPVRCNTPLGRLNKMKGILEAFRYRMDPDVMRYPLLDNESGNDSYYKLTAFARVDGKGRPVIVPDDPDEARAIKEKANKQRSTINLVVVIDGTTSMGKYYKPTKDIIKKATDFLKNDNQNVVKVGVVIYRDYSDGDYITEYVPMTTPDNPRIASFLDSGGKYGVKSSPNDKTAAEALYKGLELALDTLKMGYSKHNSNFMLVIGDCGNDDNDTQCISQNEIINRCVKNNVQVSAFQVANRDNPAFSLFRSQMGAIIRGNMKQQYGKFVKENNEINNYKKAFAEINDGYVFETNLPEHLQYYIGELRNESVGKDMAVEKLGEMVEISYIKFRNVILASKKAIDNAETIFAGDATTKNVSENSIAQAYLSTVFDDSEISKLKSSNSLMAFEGYTAKKGDYDYWKPIIYISAPELSQLIDKLTPVMTAASQEDYNNRRPYVEAMKALLRSMVPDISEEEMNNMGNQEIMAMIAGLNVKTAAQGYKLSDIQDEKAVSKQLFASIIANFKNKFNKIKRIKEIKYDFSVKRNNMNWYWIPVEDLP